MIIERALIVRQPWIDLILSGEKTWEMRSMRTNIRGRIGLIEQGSGLIVGECNIFGCGNIKLEPSRYEQTKIFHRIDNFDLLSKWCYPWGIGNAKRYEKPIKYNHHRGAVTWVKVNYEI